MLTLLSSFQNLMWFKPMLNIVLWVLFKSCSSLISSMSAFSILIFTFFLRSEAECIKGDITHVSVGVTVWRLKLNMQCSIIDTQICYIYIYTNSQMSQLICAFLRYRCSNHIITYSWHSCSGGSVFDVSDISYFAVELGSWRQMPPRWMKWQPQKSQA